MGWLVRLEWAVAVVLVAGLVWFVVPSFAAPAFVVINRSAEPVTVVASWRQTARPLGRLASGDRLRFTVADEAAMRFAVTYPDGRQLESEPIYFTAGIVVFTEIEADRVESRYDFEP